MIEDKYEKIRRINNENKLNMDAETLNIHKEISSYISEMVKTLTFVELMIHLKRCIEIDKQNGNKVILLILTSFFETVFENYDDMKPILDKINLTLIESDRQLNKL